MKNDKESKLLAIVLLTSVLIMIVGGKVMEEPDTFVTGVVIALFGLISGATACLVGVGKYGW